MKKQITEDLYVNGILTFIIGVYVSAFIVLGYSLYLSSKYNLGDIIIR